VKIVYKHYVVHPQVATTPALAACAAHKQGKFAPMEKLIWDKGYSANRNLGEDNMLALAKEAGLNVDKFKADMNGEECKQLIQTDQAQLAKVGVRGTPAFFINGRHLSGAQPFEQFKALIDEELKKADERIKAGTKVADYYKTWVLEKGQASL
jgi:predicted DsbA family dithiol-disulfide isomerase